MSPILLPPQQNLSMLPPQPLPSTPFLLTRSPALTNNIEPSDIDPDKTETDDDIIAQRLAGIEEQKRKRSRKE